MGSLSEQRLSASVPRYTSYPTAPHFTPAVDAGTYSEWLGTVDADASLSLYVHLPFCDRLCWFCACSTKQVRRYDPVARYVSVLDREVKAVSRLLGGRGRVSAVHFGGGSPTLMNRDDWLRVSESLKSGFALESDAEISVEIDPNDMDAERHRALAEAGMTRASLGVQDFDPKVQRAINRMQTFDQTAAAVQAVRSHGVRSVNLDVLYGLPHQTEASVAETVAQVLLLRPDRIALFGYAHVPWMKKHQTMIDEAVLPDAAMRLAQANLAARMLEAAGYEAIGIDHFALPGDRLSAASREGGLRRNFQGYTTDQAEVTIGLGASAIGRFPQGYVQNSPSTPDYERRVGNCGLATTRGFVLGKADRIRAFVIERLMCNFSFSARSLADRFGKDAETVLAEARRLADEEAGLFVHLDDGFAITDRGRLFTRLIASRFDQYLDKGVARHSTAI